MTMSAAAAPPAAMLGSLATVYAVPNATAAAMPLMTFSGSRVKSITVPQMLSPSSSSSSTLSNAAADFGADFLTVIDSGMSRSSRSAACISFAAAANISLASGSSSPCASASSPPPPAIPVATNRARLPSVRALPRLARPASFRVPRLPRVPARVHPPPPSRVSPPRLAVVVARIVPRPDRVPIASRRVPTRARSINRLISQSLAIDRSIRFDSTRVVDRATPRARARSRPSRASRRARRARRDLAVARVARVDSR